MSERSVPDSARYRGYGDLARAQVRGRDYDIHSARAPSAVAVLAPHGGGIENGTSELARAIAQSDFNLYLFEGLRCSGNFAALHLTSALFDEPECLALIADCRVVIAVHGCDGEGERVFLGGRDVPLKERIAAAMIANGIAADTAGHRFPAIHPRNICNRGATGIGVQLEATHALRRGSHIERLAAAVRPVLMQLDDAVAEECNSVATRRTAAATG